jgi:hypothetical protein
MICRLALLLALLSPAAALAQTTPAAGTVVISPATFGSADCTSTTAKVGLTWTSSSTPVAGANEIYRVWVSTDTSCPSTGTPTGATQLPGELPGGDIAAVTATQSYLPTLTRSDFITKAGITGITRCTTDKTIYVCVQHLASGGTAKDVATGNALLQVEPPPVPINVVVSPGDSALFVGWEAGTKKPDGTTSTVAAVSYNVTAVAQANALDTRTKNSVNTSYRIDGLVNDRTYGVTVASVSAGGNVSAATNAVFGTPLLVNGFWEQYTDAGGHEPGGCGGGPAGLVALLGVALALALRGLRRRS